MIVDGKNYYILNTKNTSYIFRITESGHLEHLYYGKRIRVTDSLGGLIERHEFPAGNNNVYSPQHPTVVLNNMCLEASFEGKGDNREAFAVINNSDGSRTSDFLFESAEIKNDKPELKNLPSAYGKVDTPTEMPGKNNHLHVILFDKYNDIRLHIDYYVYESCDVITRTSCLVNEGQEPITVKQLMSAQLDMYESGYIMSTFNGAWTREMCRKDVPLFAGKHINSSYTGTSSSNANPFFMLSTPYTTENSGIAYGFNLVYSGNHAEIAEVNEFGKTRLLWGINPRGFSWRLESGESFETPEAVMTFSDKGFNGMSAGLHNFIHNHVTRGEWAKKIRPVLLNSWEANYFDINETKLLNLARESKDIGIELFVMDDGWFGERNSDSKSLGDWTPDKKKLPNGLKGLVDKINKMGLDFGIWVEPEMVNVDSKLYKAHPDWVLGIPDKPHSEGRNQRMLDMGRKDVQDFVIKSVSQILKSANITYVKWDMNRTVTDIYSTQVSEERPQGEILHRYVMGLYKCMKTLTERFPYVLFEGCAAGGNRFDLGILSYFPQIWGSDDTDPLARAEIQTGYSYGYPQSCWGSHVSASPNHQTLRITNLETRYDVAIYGILGYELNLLDVSKEAKEQLKEQIKTYKKSRRLFQYGQMYRGRSFTGHTMFPGISSGDLSSSVITNNDSNITEWTVVSKDKKKAAGMILQRTVVPNSSYQFYRGDGLDEDMVYHIYNREIKVDIKVFGGLINTALPIHIRPESFTHRTVSRFYKMPGDVEDMKAFGGSIMNAGIKLLPAYTGTGFNDKTRIFSDFASRLLFMEAEDI